MTSSNQPGDRTGPQAGLRFGGWSSYQEWAEHDFRPRSAAEERTKGFSVPIAVEILAELKPLIVPEHDAGDDSRTACVLVPPPQAQEPGTVSEARDGGYRLSLDTDDATARIRPYVRANGRATAAHELEFETVLTATGLHECWTGDRELTDDQIVICTHCEAPRSVAEIAAALRVPIGVAKVLIGDAIDRGLLMLHERAPDVGTPPLELLRRVHAGIANLA